MGTTNRVTSRQAPEPTTPVQAHGVRSWLRLVQWIGLLAGGLGLTFCLGMGIWRWTLAYTNYGPAVVWRWSLPWLAAAAGLAPLFLLALISLWRTRDKRVLVYPSGLVYQRGSSTTDIPWQEIVAVRTQGPGLGLRLAGVARPLSLVLETKDGSRLRFTQELQNFKSLVETVKQKVYPPMLRALTERFNRGGAVDFGPITLSPEALRVGRQEIPWPQVAGAEIAAGKLTLIPVQGSRHSRIQLSTAQIPNVDLCFQMIQSVKQT